MSGLTALRNFSHFSGMAGKRLTHQSATRSHLVQSLPFKVDLLPYCGVDSLAPSPSSQFGAHEPPRKVPLEFIEVKYNEDLKPLEIVLSGVKRPGDFFVSGVLEMPMPQIAVEGIGTLSFPIPDDQIAALLRHSERAPYGRGRKTIVDTSVRKVWQIAPDKVRIGGKSWAANFGNILSQVSAGLGCVGAIVSAELYKLLVYDRGGFFLPHRDTEKTDGMFGTLVLTLPSLHRGGELRIRHAGREVTVDTSAAEFSELSYVAFYADCEHEALPVRQGNRVCLVYNLVESPGKGRTLKAPDYESQIAEAAVILDRSLSGSDAPAKIAWLLEHQYSPAGLSFFALKGADAAKAGVLAQAAERAQCATHLGIVHIGESGAAEPDFDEYSYRSRWNHYRYYEDDEAETEDEEDDEGASFTVVTVDDAWRYVDEWRDTRDVAAEFGPIPLADGELLPEGALDEEPPDKERLTEASGNEGASYERSYHRAALVLWPRRRYSEVLLQAGVVAALPYLKQLVAGGKESQSEALALAERMVGAWQTGSQRWDYYYTDGNRPESSHRIEMMAALNKLRAAALLERFITATVIPHYDGSENAALISSVGVLGDANTTAVFSALISARMPNRPNECAELLLALSQDSSRCFTEVAESFIAGLDRIGIREPKSEAEDWEPEERRRPLSPQFLVNLLQALRRFKRKPFCDAAVEKIAARPETFSPVTIVVPAIEQIQAERTRKVATSDSSVVHLWTGSAEFLLCRSEVPPEPPSDWRLDVKLSCSCPDCRELQTFARDPAQRVHRFRVKKARRQHLHNAIDTHRLDMTHVTEHVGSPHTLVCTKDRRTFDRRMKQYGHEIAAMRTLIELAPSSDAATDLSTRMQAAVERAGGRT